MALLGGQLEGEGAGFDGAPAGLPGAARPGPKATLPELAPDAACDHVERATLKHEQAAMLDRRVDSLFKGNLRPYVAEAVERNALRLI